MILRSTGEGKAQKPQASSLKRLAPKAAPLNKVRSAARAEFPKKPQEVNLLQDLSNALREELPPESWAGAM